MAASYTPTSLVDAVADIAAIPAAQEFARDVRAGLSARPKYLLPKYFYDEAGSKLFEQICFQEEYYLTRTEAEIIKNHSSEIIAQALQGRNEGGHDDDGGRVNIIELGSGTSTKTRILFRALMAEREQKRAVYYYPIDISHTALLETANMLSGDFPNLHVREIIGDYSSGLQKACKLASLSAGQAAVNDAAGPAGGASVISEGKMILFLGSSIGNLDPLETAAFLRMIRRNMAVKLDSLLVGFDLQKDAEVLEAAYNDRAGVTAKFNLNLLERINRELGGDFDLSAFRHNALYNRSKHRIEMHLASSRSQTVHIGALGQKFRFRKGETIHTENSYKYSLKQIERLARRCGLQVRKHFTDERGWFDLCLLSVAS